MSTSKLSIYLFRNGIGSICRALLVPWLITYLDYCCDTTWSDAVVSYGFFYSSLNLGSFIGGMTHKKDAAQWKFALILIAFSYAGLAMTTRISLLLVFALLMGYAGAIVNGNEMKIVSTKMRTTGMDYVSFFASSTSSTPEVGNEINMQRKISIFAFFVLLSGIAYREGEHVYSVSLKMPSLIMVGICFVITAIKSYLDRSAKKASSAMSSSSSQGGADAASGNYSRDASTTQQYPSVPAFADVGSDVPTYTGGVSQGYLRLFKGDLAAAQKAYGTMLRWRELNKVDDIFITPQPYFEEILHKYPHAIHGKSKDGCVVLYEVLGKARPKELAVLPGFTTDNLVWHFMMRNEYCFQKLFPPQNLITTLNPASNSAASETKTMEGQIMTVIDVKGVSVADISADVISFIKKSSEIMDAYYPGRVNRLVICNAPIWFYSVWSMVARVLPDSVRKKISIIGGCSGLNEFIEPSQRPVEYEGTGLPLGQTPEHLKFVEIGHSWGPTTLVSAGAEISQHPVGTRVLPDVDSSLARASTSSGGIVGWVKSKVTGGRQTSAAADPTDAYLGEKNLYRFDKESSSWVMGPSEDSSDNNSAKKMTQEQLEEHGLVLAIQAAHLAAMDKRDQKIDLEAAGSGYSHSGFGGVSVDHLNQPGILNASATLTSAPADRALANPVHAFSANTTADHRSEPSPASFTFAGSVSSALGGSKDNGAKLSAGVFLLATGCYFLACLVQSSCLVFIPVLLVTTRPHGGFGYSVLDCAYVLSSAAMILYVAHILFMNRFLLILRSSPVRALRIACSGFVLISFLMPILMGIDVVSTDYTNESITVAVVPASTQAVPIATNSEINGNLATAGTVVVTHLLGWSPTASLFAVPTPAVLIASLVAVTFCARKATGMMLYVALSQTFSSPNTFISIISGFAEVIGPIFGALLFAATFEFELPYPMDAHFVVSVSACLCALLYFCSLFIGIQFRGDFGVVGDPNAAGPSLFASQAKTYKVPTSPRGGRAGGQIPMSPGASYTHEGCFSLLPRECIETISNCTSEVIDIPARDFSVLLYPPNTSYGSGIHSAKIDLKEV